MLIEDACVDCAFAVDLVGGDEAECSKLDIDQPIFLEMDQKGTYSVLNRHANEGVVVRAHDGRQVLSPIAYTITAWRLSGFKSQSISKHAHRHGSKQALAEVQ